MAEFSRGLVAGSRGVGAVQHFAQGAAGGKLHHGQVAGHFQGEFVAVFAFGFGQLARCVNHVSRDACKFTFSSAVGKCVGCVQGVFAELLAQFGLAFLNFGKARFGVADQLCARQHKAAQSVFVRLLLLNVQRGNVNGFVLGIQAFVSRQSG